MRRGVRLLLGIAMVAACLAAIAAPPAGAATLPSGFVDEAVASIGSPTSLAFTPDGRLLVTTQGGTVRVVKDGALLATPAITLAPICSNSERGLLGIAVDPNFTTNGYVFLYYTPRIGGLCDGDEVNRVSRFVMTGDTLATETVLVDNMPSPAGNHNAGDLEFGKDGFLYVSVGDGGCDYLATGNCGASNDASRDENVLLGKILRIDRNGGIPAGNPYASDPNAARCNITGRTTTAVRCQETFARGLRNPFKIAFDPNAAGTRFYIDDVGQSTWEEIDDGAAGADYGWNVREGHCPTGVATNCGPPPAGMTDPIFDYGRADGCGTITGGAFVPTGVWSSAYQGKYLFADYLCGKIFRLDPNGSGGFNRVDFVTALGGSSATDLRFGPFGRTQALYYTSYASGGQVRRVYDATTIPPLPVQGFTWHHDGSATRSGAPGMAVSVYGTALQANTQYRVISSPAQTQPDLTCTVDPVPVNPNVRTSNGRGFIAYTSGAVNRPPGNYDVCWVRTDGNLASASARVAIT